MPGVDNILKLWYTKLSYNLYYTHEFNGGIKP